MPSERSKNERLNRIASAVKKGVSKEEQEAQRVSFVMSMLTENNNATRSKVEGLLKKQVA